MNEEYYSETRPWGSFEVLKDSKDYKVKVLKVNPTGILSLQSHKHRSEQWYVVKGTAYVRVGDDYFELGVGEDIKIPQGSLHRLENKTQLPLELIEIQTGTYFGEDDIERFEDAYGRD